MTTTEPMLTTREAFDAAKKAIADAYKQLEGAILELDDLPAPADLKCCPHPWLFSVTDGMDEYSQVRAESSWVKVDAGWDAITDVHGRTYILCGTCDTPFAHPKDIDTAWE